ncbi:conserved repeat domain-containing protein [Paenibacillus catalpae]|uniref:Conserved repeat domain-containing protein n=1 Tax=Paenibacillus catalpae TaxID=1045775 RepID=A0A1I1T100_9BACL|nr:conserved repeat domain-containing protein [Paenibacillus catalpae]
MLKGHTKQQMPFRNKWQNPMTFTKNAGQVRNAFRYVSNGPGCRVGFSPEEVLLVFTGKQEGLALSLRFLAANGPLLPEGRQPQSEKVHYLTGKDPANWHTNLPTYREIAYREPWPGIDVFFYAADGDFKYDVIAQPGARLRDIRFAYYGSDSLAVSSEGDLQICTPYGILTEKKPVSYQIIDGLRVTVESRFILPEGQKACIYGFEVEEYNPNYELIIDPALTYSTFLGGSDTDTGFSIAADPFGNAYVTGQTLSFDFPITPGAFQPSIDGSSSVFVSKLNSDGSSLEYSTYLGGSSADQGNSIAVDEFGHAYLTGQTLSPDFPTTPNTFQPFLVGNQNAFVTKLSPDGSSLIYSTFLGGQGVDTGFSIAVDGVGSAYVTGSTNSFDFPITSSALQPVLNGNLEDAFVAKISPDGTLLEYSTFLGGFGIDEAFGIAVDGSGDAYVTGMTTSFDFPTTPGAFQISPNGVISAFVSKINGNGTALLYSTYLTGGGDDEAKGIAVDEFGQAYVTGSTTSFDFPITPGAYQPFYHGGASDAFVTKLSPDGNYLVYSTFLGGEGADSGNGIAVRSGFAYVTGNTGSFNFPITPDAIQPFPEGGDGFLTQFNIDGASLVFSTFIGGSSSDADNAVAVDNQGSVYLTGQTFSPNFPVTPGVVQPFLRGSSDAFVMKFSLGFDILVNKFTDRFEVSPGEQVTYFIEIHNPNAAPLTNVVIEDHILGFFHVIPELPPFSIQIFDFIFHVPQDFPLGLFRNTVTVRADQIGEPIVAETEILVTGTPVLVAFKNVNPAAATPGEVVFFTIVLENHGNADLINVHITDPLIGLDEFVGDIHVGMSIVIDWPFVIPPDAQAGPTIANLAKITADNLPNPEEIGTVVEVLPVPRLEIIKTADRNVVLPGESVNFFITVINTGNTDMTNVSVTDDLTGFETVVPVLFPGQSETFVLSLFIPLETQPQNYTNTAVAVSNQTEPVFANEEITVPADPRLGIIKSPDSLSSVIGQTIQYTVTLANIGNVPLTGIRILDPLLGIDQPGPDLAVGEVREILFTFTIPRETPIGSNIINILSVISNETGGQEVESNVTVDGVGLTLLKESDLAAAVPGTTVTYTLTITNLLDVPQTNVVLIDALLGFSETIPSLPANGTITRTVVFTIPLDAEAGSVIRNTFTAESDQIPILDTIAEVVVLETPGPALVIQKITDRNTASPGETVIYTLTITNLLDIPQTNVILSDALLGLSETIASLPANGSVTRTLMFTVPADALIGSIIRNTFTAVSDQTPQLETVAEVAVQGLPAPSLVIHKLPDRNSASPGEIVTYALTVTNLLDIPQTNVVLSDPLLGLSETIASLPANGTVTRTLSFTIPDDTVIGSIIRNTFTVSSDQTPLIETIAEVVVQIAPAEVTTLTVRKLSDRTVAEPGETIQYTVEVTNTGSAPATSVAIQDSLTGEQFNIPVIAPGETERISFAFVVPASTTQGTVIANRVTVTWPEQPAGTSSLQDEARITVTIPAELPEVNIEALPESPKPGETVLKTIIVTNVTGRTLTNVRISDPLLGFRTRIPVLVPGESRTFTLQLPIPAGTSGGTVFRNTVTVFSDETPLQQGEVTVQAQALPDASLTETVDRPIGRPGETVFFTLRASNTGNVPLLNVRLSAPLLDVQLRLTEFDPGASETLRVPFVLPDVEEETIIVSPVTLVSDNGPLREASASVTVIPEEEE